jgi:hypothetical protein
VRLLVLVRAHAEVLVGLARGALAADEDRVGAGRGAEGELVEGEGLAAGGDDALAGRAREAEGGDRHLGDDEETLVVSDGADEDEDLVAVGVGVVRVLDDPRDRQRRPVGLGVKQALEDDLVELRVGPAGKEAVKLQGGIAGGASQGRRVRLCQAQESEVDQSRRRRWKRRTFTSKRR